MTGTEAYDWGLGLLELSYLAASVLFIVVKRGVGKGYAAIENSLFFNKKSRMLSGDAKETLQSLVSEVKKL